MPAAEVTLVIARKADGTYSATYTAPMGGRGGGRGADPAAAPAAPAAPVPVDITDFKVEGAKVTFSVSTMGRNGVTVTKYEGTLAGDTITGTRTPPAAADGTAAAAVPWVAMRAPAAAPAAK